MGVGAIGLASVQSVVAHLGAFGPLAQAFSAVIAMLTALLMAPFVDGDRKLTSWAIWDRLQH